MNLGISKIFLLATIFINLGCGNSAQSLKIKGSDTEVNLAVDLAEEFYSNKNEFNIAVSGGGSGLGIASLYNGQADIANSSRPLSEDEIKMFQKKGIELVTNVFAEDATAIVVNSNIDINEFDTSTLAKIFSGAINNWKEITTKDLPINIYGRQNNSGTHSFVQKKLGIKFSLKAKEMNGNAQILEGIKHDPSGIGYVGAGYLLGLSSNDPIKVLKIKTSKDSNAISPLDLEAIKQKTYFFQRPLYQFIPKKNWTKAEPFINFEKTEIGKSIIKKSGYYVAE